MPSQSKVERDAGHERLSKSADGKEVLHDDDDQGARKKARTVSGLFGTAMATIKGIVGTGGEKDDIKTEAAATSVVEVNVGGKGAKAKQVKEEAPSSAPPTRRKSGRVMAAAAASAAAAATPATKSTASKAAKSPKGGRAAASAGVPDDGLTAFEREREERIARNKERMAALNIGQLAAEVASAGTGGGGGGPSQRGIGAKRQRAPKEDPGPVRRSLRSQKIAPDAALAGGVDYERRDGTVILTNGMTSGGGGGGGESQDKGPSRPVGDVPLESVNGDEGADEAFIKFLRDSLAAPTASAKSFAPGAHLTSVDFAASLGSEGRKGGKKAAAPGESTHVSTSTSSLASTKLTLTDEAVAKVVPRGVTHLDMAPYDPAGPLVVAAGDKDGNVGLWRVDQLSDQSNSSAAAEASDTNDGSEDGVLYYRPHGSYICHLKWGRGGLAGRLVTCAYDGAVRTLDAEKGVFTELFASQDEDEFSACDVTADGRTAYLVDNIGNFHVVDARSGKLTAPAVGLHEKKINTVHVEPGAERLIATSCGDQTVCVWDVRNTGKGAKPVSRLQHSKSCQAAYFAPDGSGHLLTTCYDDLLRVWRPKPSPGGGAGAINTDPKSALKIKHNNQTGRWVLPFRAVWTPAGDGIVVGSMKREVELFDATSGKLALKLSDPDRMTAIASRFAVHPTLNVVAAGTASGRLHIYRNN